MDVLEPVVQPYAWGSRHAIAEIQGRPAPAAGPEAELWMGAHPSGPSGLTRRGRRTTLDRVIAADPAAELGESGLARFGPRLPFLLKILAPDKPLSIQVHPDRAQAEAGYREETRRGVAPQDRNYVDDWPKPELLCSVTRFEALAGFRPAAGALGLLAELDVPRLRPVAAVLAADGATNRVDALRRILTWPPAGRPALLAEVTAACARLTADPGHHTEPAERADPAERAEAAEHAAACQAVLRVAASHPGDIGAVATLLLKHTVLQPGEALFMPAGGLHAYLHGVGVELMANSDNVLRAGLTGKRIDIPELLRLTDPEVPVPVIHPRRVSEQVLVYDTPAPEFRLYRVDLTTRTPVPGTGPRIAACLDGAATLRGQDGDSVKLAGGESCFIPARDPAVTAAGRASLFVAASGSGHPPP